MFDEIAMAVVSQTPSITKIQDEIAGWLGVEKLPDNDKSARGSFCGKESRTSSECLSYWTTYGGD